MSKLYIVFKENREIKFLSKRGSEIFQDVFEADINKITRASHVEPLNINDKTVGWYIDFSPVNGKVLFPFVSYDEAIIKEVEIIDHMHSLGITDMSDFISPLIKDKINNGYFYGTLSEIEQHERNKRI